jgi:hypothetical protein
MRYGDGEGPAIAGSGEFEGAMLAGPRAGTWSFAVRDDIYGGVALALSVESHLCYTK